MESKLDLYIPKYFYKNVFEIDYQLMKQRGIKALFFDLDNTLIDYEMDELPHNIRELLTNLKKDFEVLIITNNSKKRAVKAINDLMPIISRAFKPLKKGFRKALKLVDAKENEILMIGDQLSTDIKGSNKMGIENVLVLPIKVTTDAWTTKINRYFEQKKINKIKDKYPEIYEQRIKLYEKHRNAL